MFVRRWAWHTIENVVVIATHDAILKPSIWVRRFAPAIPQGGVVLDLACGTGRHAKFLADLGYSVLAVDQDISGVSALNHPKITSKCLNLEQDQWPLENRLFSGIVVTNYLYRPFIDHLPEMLENGGVLIYETFSVGNEIFGKPSNPNFLLKSGELLSFSQRHSLKVIAYEDIYTDQPKPAMVQRVCAVKGALKSHIPLQFQA